MPQPDTDLLVIRGGLPGGIIFATSGDREWHRRPGEGERAFLDRALAAARDLALPYVIAGGLPCR